MDDKVAVEKKQHVSHFFEKVPIFSKKIAFFMYFWMVKGLFTPSVSIDAFESVQNSFEF